MLHMSDQSEQFIGKCCHIVSYLDIPSKLRHVFNGDLPSNYTKPTKKDNTNRLISDKFCHSPVIHHFHMYICYH